MDQLNMLRIYYKDVQNFIVLCVWVIAIWFNLPIALSEQLRLKELVIPLETAR